MKKFIKGFLLIGALSLAIGGAQFNGDTQVAMDDPIHPPVGSIELAAHADPIHPPVGVIKNDSNESTLQFVDPDVKIFGDDTTACWWCPFVGIKG